MKQQIQEWAEENYELGGHWIVEMGSAGDFKTLQEAIEHCELMEEMESNTRYGDEGYGWDSPNDTPCRCEDAPCCGC